MDLFEHADETRQQRLGLTWSGKNEQPEGSKKILLVKEPPKLETPSEEEIDMMRASSEIALEDELAEVKAAEAEVEAMTEEEVPEPAGDILEAEVDEYDYEPQEQMTAAAEAPEPEPVHEVVEEPVAVEAPKPIKLQKMDPVVNDEPEEATADIEEVVDVPEETTAELEDIVDVPETVSDVTTDISTPAVGHEEGATTSMLALTPAGFNDESHSQPMEQTAATGVQHVVAESDTVDEPDDQLVQHDSTKKLDESELENPKHLKITRPAVAIAPEDLEEQDDADDVTTDDAVVAAAIPEKTEEADEQKVVATAVPVELDDDADEQPVTQTARPALKLSVPIESNTQILKPKKEQAVNTCKLKPETSEIVADSLGEKLRAARELAGLTEYELAEKTRISSEYITALENEKFAELPLAPIYIKSYLKTLARQFGLDADTMINEYEAKTGTLKAKQAQPEPSTTEETKAKKPSAPMPKWLSRGIVAAAALMAILAIAGVLFNKYGLGSLEKDALAIISEESLEQGIRQEFLEIRHMSIPQSETAAANDM